MSVGKKFFKRHIIPSVLAILFDIFCMCGFQLTSSSIVSPRKLNSLAHSAGSQFIFNIQSIKLAGHYRSSWTIYWFRSLHCIYQLLQKHSIATITKLWSLELPIKTPLLHILYYINELTHDFWTRTGGWEFDRSHGAGTSSPSHHLLMTLVPVQKLCVNIYVYLYMYVHSLYEFCYRSYIQRDCHSVLAKLHPITLYRGVRGFPVWMPFCVFFGLPIVSCSLIKI